MLDPKLLDDIARRLSASMPATARAVQDDLEKKPARRYPIGILEAGSGHPG